MLDPEERRRHLYVVGQTGTGKSTLLLSLIRQDLMAGEGLALLDPHGDLAEDVLAHIPKARTRVSIPAIPISRSRRSRSPIPIDPDQCGAGCERAPLDAFLDLTVAFRFQVRREPVAVVKRRDPRATRSGP